MGKLKSYGRQLLIGMKMGLTPSGAARLKTGVVEYTEEAATLCKELAIEKRSAPCVEVQRIKSKCGEQARKYQRLTRGTARYIPSSGDGRCRKWLKGYYLWTAALFEKESEKIADIPIINIPDMPNMPDMPSIPDWNLPDWNLPEFPKLPTPDFGIAKYIVLLVILIIGLIALGYSGIGDILKTEHGRKRG